MVPRPKRVTKVNTDTTEVVLDNAPALPRTRASNKDFAQRLQETLGIGRTRTRRTPAEAEADRQAVNKEQACAALRKAKADAELLEFEKTARTSEATRSQAVRRPQTAIKRRTRGNSKSATLTSASAPLKASSTNKPIPSKATTASSHKMAPAKAQRSVSPSVIARLPPEWQGRAHELLPEEIEEMLDDPEAFLPELPSDADKSAHVSDDERRNELGSERTVSPQSDAPPSQHGQASMALSLREASADLDIVPAATHSEQLSSRASGSRITSSPRHQGLGTPRPVRRSPPPPPSHHSPPLTKDSAGRSAPRYLLHERHVASVPRDPDPAIPRAKGKKKATSPPPRRPGKRGASPQQSEQSEIERPHKSRVRPSASRTPRAASPQDESMDDSEVPAPPTKPSRKKGSPLPPSQDEEDSDCQSSERTPKAPNKSRSTASLPKPPPRKSRPTTGATQAKRKHTERSPSPKNAVTKKPRPAHPSGPRPPTSTPNPFASSSKSAANTNSKSKDAPTKPAFKSRSNGLSKSANSSSKPPPTPAVDKVESDNEDETKAGRYTNEDIPSPVTSAQFKGIYLAQVLEYLAHDDDIWVTAPTALMKEAEDIWKKEFPDVRTKFALGHPVYELTLQRICEWRSGIGKKGCDASDKWIKDTYGITRKTDWDQVADDIEIATSQPLYPFACKKVRYTDEGPTCSGRFLNPTILRLFAEYIKFTGEKEVDPTAKSYPAGALALTAAAYQRGLQSWTNGLLATNEKGVYQHPGHFQCGKWGAATDRFYQEALGLTHERWEEIFRRANVYMRQSDSNGRSLRRTKSKVPPRATMVSDPDLTDSGSE